MNDCWEGIDDLLADDYEGPQDNKSNFSFALIKGSRVGLIRRISLAAFNQLVDEFPLFPKGLPIQ